MDKQTYDSERLLVRPKRACYLLDCGITHLYELIAKGEITSFLDGRSRKITLESINHYIAKHLAAASQQRAGLSADRQEFQKVGECRPSGQGFKRAQLPYGKIKDVPEPRRRGRSRKDEIGL
jgi:excisionase family DNA binding protein